MSAEQEMERTAEVILMNKVKVSIWGRGFELNVSFDNFPDEEVTENQKLTVEEIPSIDFSESLPETKQYVAKHNGSELEGTSSDNIFKYVMPKSIVIMREKEDRVFAVFCNYKFDMEHGLAVVYENGRFKTVGPQDIIL